MATKTAARTPAQLTPEECERRLILASEQFMRGEISVEEFEEAERRYMPDYRSALVTLRLFARVTSSAKRAGHEAPPPRGRERSLKRFARRQAKRLVAY